MVFILILYNGIGCLYLNSGNITIICYLKLCIPMNIKVRDVHEYGKCKILISPVGFPWEWEPNC